ncbi:hypothetical protein PHISP_03180 [Aspergillus sp. HF37]|nr:hypothetical protein PHISP_03180 [Aspergillus sp. HF37]
MPHRVNDSNSTINSGSSSGDRAIVPDLRGPNPVQRKPQPPVIVHNKGGPTYDNARPSGWDYQRWK